MKDCPKCEGRPFSEIDRVDKGRFEIDSTIREEFGIDDKGETPEDVFYRLSGGSERSTALDFLGIDPLSCGCTGKEVALSLQEAGTLPGFLKEIGFTGLLESVLSAISSENLKAT